MSRRRIDRKGINGDIGSEAAKPPRPHHPRLEGRASGGVDIQGEVSVSKVGRQKLTFSRMPQLFLSKLALSSPEEESFDH